MNSSEFLRPRFVGERFNDHAIPLECLRDLAVLEEFIIEVAKAEYRKDHADRPRSPRGFGDKIKLKLAAVDNGSAVPVITLSLATVVLPFFYSDEQIYIERARETIVQAIAAAEHNSPVTDILPVKMLGYFDKFGRSLRDNEAIEFTTPTITGPARLTRDTRRRLVLASSTVNEITEEMCIRGTIPEADQDNMSFEIQLYDGRKIKAPLAAEHLTPIIEAFGGYRNGQRVSVEGIGRFSRTNKLLSIDSVDHVALLDPLDVSARLDELRLLKDGWLDGEGKAPVAGGLDWLTEAFLANFPDALPLPHTYPTPEGDIRLEWSFDLLEVSVEIDLATRQAIWHQLDTGTDEDKEETFDLTDSSGWNTLSQRLHDVSGGVA